MTYYADSPALLAQPLLGRILGARIQRRLPADAVLAWGRKPSASRAERTARRLGLPLLRIEDGFLRSFGTAPGFPALSLVADHRGIYYDSTGPSDLEHWLAGPEDLLHDPEAIDRAIGFLRTNKLSKYNHAPDMTLMQQGHAVPAVVVLDQTVGDLSVVHGSAGPATFERMLQAAIDENPGADVWIKTHPEVASGRKRGYLSHTRPAHLPHGGRLLALRDAFNPIDLLLQADKAYVVTSGMGFEALLCGKPVRCFGLPWYAGWGQTEDEQRCERRTRSRSVRELFAAAYMRYCRYLDPVTHTSGTIFDVMDWLVRQRRFAGLA